MGWKKSWIYLSRSQNTRLGVYVFEVKKQQALSPKVRIKRWTSGLQCHNSPCVFKMLICLPFGTASTLVQNTLSQKENRNVSNFVIFLSFALIFSALVVNYFPPKHRNLDTSVFLMNRPRSRKKKIRVTFWFSHKMKWTNKEKFELLVCQKLYTTYENNHHMWHHSISTFSIMNG